MNENLLADLSAWLTQAGLAGTPETDIVSVFCERCVAAGVPLARAVIFVDTLHPVHEGRPHVRFGSLAAIETFSGRNQTSSVLRGMAPLNLLGLEAMRHALVLPRPRLSALIRCAKLDLGRSYLLLLHPEQEDAMPDSVYKVIELIGTSNESWEKAAATALEKAAKSLRDLRVAEVVELDLQLDAKGKVEAYRTKLNVSFKFEGS